jgi:DNA-binding PadR family transcriptional regulator
MWYIPQIESCEGRNDMSLKHGLLGLLNYHEMTGYELAHAFNASLGFFWQGQTSQIYRELTAMERSGWLTSRRVIQEDKPNKKIYTITESGRAQLQDWLARPQEALADAMRIRSEFLMRVFFAGETSREQALQLFKDFRDQCMKALSQLDSAPEHITKYGNTGLSQERTQYWNIVAQFGECSYRSELEWAQKAIAMLEGL